MSVSGYVNPGKESSPAPADWVPFHDGLTEFAPDGHLITDLHGVIRAANYTATIFLGGRKEFLIGKPLAFFVSAADRPNFYAHLVRVARNDWVPPDWEVQLCPRGSESIAVRLNVAVLSGDDGAATGLRWLMRDITSSKRTQQALEAQKHFADILVSTAPTAIVVVDYQGRILRANPYLATLSGYTADELLGRDWCELLMAADDRDRARDMLETLMVGVSARGVFAVVPREGGHASVAWTGRCLNYPGEPPAILLTGQDVTALQKAQQKALQAERLAAMGQMMAGLAHESRNALQRIQSCLSVLALRLQDRPEDLDLLARMQRAQDDLHRLHNEVRDYAGPVQLDRRLCRLTNLWRDAWQDVSPSRQARLHEDTGGVDWVCLADPFKLKQVLCNLFENALAAAGDPPQVEVRCSPAMHEGRAMLRLVVRDNGPGFALEPRGRVFEPFFTTKVRGTGLGLAICKRIVEAHDGWIEIGPGPGGEVVLLLPRQAT